MPQDSAYWQWTEWYIYIYFQSVSESQWYFILQSFDKYIFPLFLFTYFPFFIAFFNLFFFLNLFSLVYINFPFCPFILLIFPCFYLFLPFFFLLIPLFVYLSPPFFFYLFSPFFLFYFLQPFFIFTANHSATPKSIFLSHLDKDHWFWNNCLCLHFHFQISKCNNWFQKLKREAIFFFF